MTLLEAAVEKAAATVLAPDIMAVQPVQPVWNKNDMLATKGRTYASVLKLRDGSYCVVPSLAALGDTTPQKVWISRTGNSDIAKATTIAELVTLGVVEASLGILAYEGEEDPGLLCNGLPATLRPVDAGVGHTVTELAITVGGGPPQNMPVEAALRAVGKGWRQWEGSAGAPPPFPGDPDILSEADASTQDMACGLVTGTGALGAVRHAVLTALRIFADASATRVLVKKVSEFVASLASLPESGRALTTAIASSAAIGESGTAMQPDSIILAAHLATNAVLQALRETVDKIDMGAVQLITGKLDALVALGLTITGSQAGQYARIALAQRAQGAAGAVAAQSAAQVAAMAAIMANQGNPPSPAQRAAAATRVEAERRLDLQWQVMANGAPPLTGAFREQGIDGMAAQMAAAGFQPAATSLGAMAGVQPAAATVGAGAAPAQQAAEATAFAALRPSWAPAMDAANAFTLIGASRSMPPADLAHALASARGRTWSNLFGTAAEDVVHVASDDFDFMLAAEGTEWGEAPQSWAEAATRLLRLCTAHQQRRVDGTAAAAAATRAAAQPADGIGGAADDMRTAVPVSAGSGAAKSAVIRVLSTSAVVAAEAAITPLEHPLHEVARLRETAYGYPAMAYIFSDGTVMGAKLPNRGEHSN
jgi:hypothetical protein